MARLVLVISHTGTGKSSSLRNFKKGEASVILGSGKELPFKTNLSTFIPKSYSDVYKAIQSATAPIVVIDDANYLMAYDEMHRSQESGYGKFVVMAKSMFDVFKTIIEKPGDQIFYVMAHAEDTEDGKLRFKTTGKMLSEKIVLEGLANTVITNEITPEGEFVFRVKTDGNGVKTPMGMFDVETIPNDLKIVDKTIREYYKESK